MPIVVVERLFDLIAILVIAAAGAIWSGRPLAGALIVVVLAPSLLGLYVAVRWVSESLGSRDHGRRPARVVDEGRRGCRARVRTPGSGHKSRAFDPIVAGRRVGAPRHPQVPPES